MAEPAFNIGRQRDDMPPSATIDEQRLINALEANVVEADTIQGSEISQQRERNHVFYAGDRLGNEKSNRSQHQSLDVLDAVESQKSYYLQSFYSGRSVVEFLPEDDRDVTSHLATQYVRQVYDEDNDGYEFTRDALHDAFVAKKAVAYVHWHIDDEWVTETLPPIPPQQLAQLEAQGAQVLGAQQVPGPNGLLVQATIQRFDDTSKTKIELVQPERYFRDPNVSYIHEAAFAGFQEDLARSELVELGYDEGEVNELNLDYRFRQNEEDAARKAHDSTWSRARRHKRSAEAEIVTVYTSFAYLDMENFTNDQKTGTSIEGTRLYKFVWSQGKLLTLPENGQKYLEVDDGMPFVEWTQYKISHSEYGLCEADVMADIQWSKSNLMRLIIDNQAMVNTSRWKAKHGFIKNPRELLENSIGSVMWMKDPERDLIPLPTAPLSPASFQTIEELNIEKENRNGLSRLAKGLNADAVAKQNADDMIERLTNASNRRVMRGVRDFAEAFLKPIFLRIYTLGQKYDRSTRMTEVSGQWVPMTPSQWPERSRLQIKVALTPEQSQEQAQFLLALDARLTQDPKVSVLYGLEQTHALLDDVCDLMGVADTSRYMRRPDDPQVQQSLAQNAQMQQQLQVLAQSMQQLQIRNEQLEQQLKLGKDQREWMKTEADVLESQAKVTDMFEDNVREDAALQLDREKAAAEYEIERTQQRAADI